MSITSIYFLIKKLFFKTKVDLQESVFVNGEKEKESLNVLYGGSEVNKLAIKYTFLNLK